MAPLTKEKKEEKAKEEVKYVTQEQLDAVTGTLLKGMEDILAKMNATPVDVKKEAQVAKASEDSQMAVPPKWEEKAREIIGDALDHCELAMPERGGTLFTVVIKNSHSNADKDYLERYKADRRTREIGNEGLGGVEEWCKLVATNLKRK